MGDSTADIGGYDDGTGEVNQRICRRNTMLKESSHHSHPMGSDESLPESYFPSSQQLSFAF
jgi:hypothetical protein